MARDPEFEHLRETVRCETVLEQAGWTYDRSESSSGAQKFRAGAGEIIIVTHDGRGWWQPLAKGDGLGEERGDVLALDHGCMVARWGMSGSAFVRLPALRHGWRTRRGSDPIAGIWITPLLYQLNQVCVG